MEFVNVYLFIFFDEVIFLENDVIYRNLKLFK